MPHRLRLLLGLAAAVLPLNACAAPATPVPAETRFARVLLARAAGASAAPAPDPLAVVPDGAAAVRPRSRDETWRGLVFLPADSATLFAAAQDDRALTRLVAQPLGADALAALAVLRHPSVRAAAARHEAARTAYAQSADLGDLVGLYRSFALDLVTGVGPERSRRATAALAPSPNVGTLSAEIARRAVDESFERLRAAVRDVSARARRAHADAGRLVEARGILREEVALDDVLLEVLRSRLEAGGGEQAGYLAFASRLERLRTELDVLEEQESVVRARWNELLARAPDAPVELRDVAATAPDELPQAEDVVALALAENQELRVARLAAERSEIAVRLAETMTLPRLDVGSSRFERERVGEAGVRRGPVFPEPGRLAAPRADFGVREAQVAEIRARSQAAAAARDALVHSTAASARAAYFAVDAARRRTAVSGAEVVPLATRSLESARGGYEGGSIGYLALLDAIRRLLDARLALADARRDLAHARADLLEAVGVETLRR